MRGRQRAVSLDPDLKAQVWEEVDVGKPNTLGRLWVALNSVAIGSARSWLHSRCTENFACPLLGGAPPPRILSIVCDASRFSNPGEARIAYLKILEEDAAASCMGEAVSEAAASFSAKTKERSTLTSVQNASPML